MGDCVLLVRFCCDPVGYDFGDIECAVYFLMCIVDWDG